MCRHGELQASGLDPSWACVVPQHAPGLSDAGIAG